MPDLIIKPEATSGNKLILKDQAGGAVLTTADSGATFSGGNIGTVTAGTINSAVGGALGWRLLETQTVTGTSTNEIDIGSATTLSSSFDDYMIVGTDIQLQNAQDLVGKMTIGGTLREGSSYGYSSAGDDANNDEHSNQNTGASEFFLSSKTFNNNAYNSANFKLYFAKPTNTVIYHKVYGVIGFDSSVAWSTGATFSATNHGHTGALTAFRFQASTSGWITGVCKLYGLEK